MLRFNYDISNPLDYAQHHVLSWRKKRSATYFKLRGDMTGRKLTLAVWFVAACRDPTHKAAGRQQPIQSFKHSRGHAAAGISCHRAAHHRCHGTHGQQHNNMFRGGWAQHHVLANDFAASVQEYPNTWQIIGRSNKFVDLQLAKFSILYY